MLSQGIVYVWPSAPSEAVPHTSTTVRPPPPSPFALTCPLQIILPRSHRDVYEQLLADVQSHDACPDCLSKHYCAIKHMPPGPRHSHLNDLFRRCCRRVPVPSGALLLWNSRTLHQGWTGGRRLAQPVCWEPRSRRSHAALVRKVARCSLQLMRT